VRHVESAATDVLLITLKKAERDYSPTTLYRDYAIAPDRFHWESQSTQKCRLADDPALPGAQDARDGCRLALRLPRAGSLCRLLRIPAGLVHLGTGYSDAWGAVRVRSHGRGRVTERERASAILE